MNELYYYKQKGEFLEKYKISFNIVELVILRKEIIDKCSYITHEEKEYSYHPSKYYNEECLRHIKNLGETRKEDLGSGSSLSYHLYSYDIYKPPILVDLIDRLIKGEGEVIEDIDNPVPSEKKFDFAKYLDRESVEIDNISNFKTDKKIEALKNFKKTMENAKLNENQKNALDYYPLVQALIERKLVATISLTEVVKVTDFFEKGIDVFDLQYMESKNNLKRVRYISHKNSTNV